MDTYVLKQADIDAMEGLSKQHFLNPNARRINKSLGDLTGLEAIGFHIIEVQAGYETTEFHRHYHEEECVYVLAGTGCAVIGDERIDVGPGDFIGYRAGGLAHTIENTGEDTLRCIVVGQRLDHDVGDVGADEDGMQGVDEGQVRDIALGAAEQVGVLGAGDPRAEDRARGGGGARVSRCHRVERICAVG